MARGGTPAARRDDRKAAGAADPVGEVLQSKGRQRCRCSRGGPGRRPGSKGISAQSRAIWQRPRHGAPIGWGCLSHIPGRLRRDLLRAGRLPPPGRARLAGGRGSRHRQHQNENLLMMRSGHPEITPASRACPIRTDRGIILRAEDHGRAVACRMNRSSKAARSMASPAATLVRPATTGAGHQVAGDAHCPERFGPVDRPFPKQTGMDLVPWHRSRGIQPSARGFPLGFARTQGAHLLDACASQAWQDAVSDHEALPDQPPLKHPPANRNSMCRPQIRRISFRT